MNYRKLLQLAKEHHVFRFYDAFRENENFILWRHDIDLSIPNALKLAAIEKEEGVGATYFIHLHNEYYNFFEKGIFRQVEKILGMGHRLGLHFDSEFYDIQNASQLEEALRKELFVLEHLFGIKVPVFSFHNPSEQVLKLDNLKYTGCINTYAKYFKEKVAYCSDSNGYWRHKSIEDTIRENKSYPVQVLTHPEWWHESIMSPKQRIWHCIDSNADFRKTEYDKNLKLYGRENIDW